MHWTSTTPTETMEWRHSAFPEMEKSSSFSALINYRYIADSTTRSWWRVCSAKTIEKKSEWTFTFNNIQFICRNKPTSHINHLESAFNFVIISTSCYIFRKKKTHTVFFCMVQHSTVISSLTYSSFFYSKYVLMLQSYKVHSPAAWLDLWRSWTWQRRKSCCFNMKCEFPWLKCKSVVTLLFWH